MTIKIGDRFPAVTVRQLTAEGPVEVTTDDFFRGKKIAVFGAPGAFTPVSSLRHLPSFVRKADEIKAFKANGLDEIAWITVNDPFVLSARGQQQKSEGKVIMLADGSPNFARAVGLDLDLTHQAFGARPQHYAMLIEDGIVKSLHIDQPGQVKTSRADVIMADLALKLGLEGNPPDKTG